MLQSLSIRDVVLIDRLDLTFNDGLCVLTGETGAGKSILLDSLGLALGVRAEARLVRHGAPQASVVAAFEVAPDHPAWALLADGGLDADTREPLLLRRTLSPDGRSRAYVNDQPVSVSLLRQVGDTCVEIHGQFESQRLLSPNVHRSLLDAHGGLRTTADAVAKAYKAWRQAADAHAQAAADMEQARRDEEFLRHAVEELAALAPAAGEEETLASQRQMMMNAEKLADALNAAQKDLAVGKGVDAQLQSAARNLQRAAELAPGRFEDILATFDRAIDELADAGAMLDRAVNDMDMDPRALEEAEERLFALRACARKHGVEVDGLAALKADMERQLHSIEDGGAELAALERAATEARASFLDKAGTLSAKRQKAAAQLGRAVTGELEPLKLGNARFEPQVETLPEDQWGAHGSDAVAFAVATNPGQPAGPLGKIASGGELSRFMLALKVVLAQADPVPTLIFDEVDAGIGGATAAAVGERLARIAQDVQVLVVTHSPQVAAKGRGHYHVSKAARDETMATTVAELDTPARREEIARMLAGAEITEEARAAAETLLGAA